MVNECLLLLPRNATIGGEKYEANNINSCLTRNFDS